MTPERLGPYKIVDRIGAGGMGEVFKGVHESTGDVVAIKLLHSAEDQDAQLLKRFRREIVSAGRLSHDNIVRLHDSGEQEDFIWYAMDFIDGCSLSDLLSKIDPLPVPQALSIAQDICKAFVYMHSRGYVHRDIKPGNIMVPKEGAAKLVDFGLVKSRFATNITVTGVVIGTPAFMSPEMLQGKDVDHRSDIFQLGQVLYRMLAGGNAFEGLNSFEIASNCISSPPKPLVPRNPKVSAALESVVFLALEKKPEERYQSAADFLNDLRRLEKGLRPIGAGKKPLVATAAAAAQQSVIPTQPIALPPRPSSVAGAGPGVALVAAGLLVAVFAYLAVSRSGGGHDFRNLRVQPGVRAARLAWDSEEPYGTRAAYAPASSPDTVQEAVNASEGDSSHHSLELRGLEPDTDYSLWIVYPGNARSLPQAFHTRKPALVSTAFTFDPDGTPRLAFQTPMPATVSVRYGQGSAVRASPGTLSTSHSVLLTGAEVFGEGSVQFQCTSHLGEEWAPPPLPLPDARAGARELARALDAAAPRILELLAALDLAEHKKKLSPSMVKDPLPKTVMESIARFAPMGPIFFRSRRPSLDEKLALYRPLTAVDALERYCARRKLPFACGVPALLGDAFGPSREPTLPDKEVFRFSEATRMIPVSSGSATADFASAFGKSARKLVVPFNVTGVASVTRAELAVAVDWQEIFVFEDEMAVRINKGLELILRRDPAQPPRERSWRFVHTFDPRALVEGANELELSVRPLAGLKSVTGIEVKEVAVRLVR